MKQIITTAAGLLIFLMTAYSQTIDLSSLVEKSKCRDSTCFHDFLITSGFGDLQVSNSAGGKVYSYLSKEEFTATSNIQVILPNIFGLTIKDSSTVIAFATCNEKDYKRKLVELILLDFNQERIQNRKNGDVVTEYLSTRFPGITLSLMVLKKTDPAGEYTQYLFQITSKVKA